MGRGNRPMARRSAANYALLMAPDKETLVRARRDAAQGKSVSTQAGEFVREQIHHVREGKHGARSTKQAIAIGLSEARRAGVKLPPPKAGRTSAKTRRQAQRDSARGRGGRITSHPTSRTRSRATIRALKKEPRSTVSRSALSRQAKSAARRRSTGDRSRSARQAARTRQRRR